ncbi:MAG: SpoIIE family protein phosphatase [Melioribacteraceae bacterium]
MKTLSSIKIILIYACLVTNSFSQNNNFHPTELGKPFLKTYSQKDYNAGRTNWCILLDKRGIVYAGNTSGIVEFDGISWRNIEVPNSESVRSMDIDENGTIYVCASSDFGYLESDSVGFLLYKSLLPFLNDNYHNFGEMWDVVTSSHGVYFKNSDKIFRWFENKITVWDSVFAYRLYNINDKIYSRNQGKGLMTIEGDSIKLMPDGDYFANIGVFNMLPFNKGESNEKERMLITTNRAGLFLYSNKKFHPFKTEMDSYLKDNQIYNACITSAGNIALSTQRGGVVVVDRNGKLIKTINKNSGLSTDVIFDIHPDPMGGLWLATFNGIVYYEIPSSFSTFKKSGLLEDQSNSVIRFNNKLYVANTMGIFYYSQVYNRFKLLSGSDKAAYKLLNVNGTLLAATNKGLAVINDDKISKFIDENTSTVLFHSTVFPNRIYFGSGGRLDVLISRNNKKYFVSYSKKNFYDDATNIVEEKNGGLWIDGYFKGIYHVTGKMDELSGGSDANIRFEFFSEKDNLPGKSIGLYSVQNKILLATERGIFSFNETSNSFLRDSTLGAVFTDTSITISLIEKNINNELWILTDSMGQKNLGKAILQSNGKFKWNAIPEFRRLNLNSILEIYSEYDLKTKKEILWLSTDESLIRYIPNAQKDVGAKFTTLLRKVVVNNDSLIFGGAGQFDKSVGNNELPFTENNVKFEFSAISFDEQESNKFQYFLKGNDDDWSEWSKGTSKEYTNLSYGKYSFHIRSKNIYGKISLSEAFHFKILSPWYLAWWAFLLYSFIIISGVFFTDRIMRGKIIRRERSKAKLVDAEHRAETAELQAKATEAQSVVIPAENNRKSKELEEARQLQLSMLPRKLPQLQNLDIAVYMQTATEVGGDYYDFHVDDNGTLTAVIGDATGHGLNAGTVVTATKSLFNTHANNPDILFTFSEMTRVIKGMKLRMLAMCLCILKIKGNQLTISSAGIPPALIYRSNTNKIEEFLIKGMPLGVMNGFPYELRTVKILPGDIILLMSDGFPELFNKEKKMFGYDKVKSVFGEVTGKKPEEIIEHLKNTGSAWVENAVPDDDVTFVVIKMR